MNKQLITDLLGWGLLLWFIGYLLGIVLFFALPPAIIGWVIMPIGILLTVWVLLSKIKSHSFPYYAEIALFWTVIAISCDYLFLVSVFKPADGYYKLDVYIYYALTFILPLVVGWQRDENRKKLKK
jgi:hypothetical protein